MAYDGKRLIETRHFPSFALNKERTTYRVVDVGRLKGPYLPFIPLIRCFVTFRCPEVPKDDVVRASFRIPELVTKRSMTLGEDLEVVNDVQCILLEGEGRERIWMAPGFNYAVVKHHRYIGGLFAWEMVADKFREVRPGMWLPMQITGTDYGWKSLGEYAGRPLRRTTYQVTKLEINNPEHDSFFEVQPTAGALVTDETLVPSGVDVASLEPGERAPSTNYIMPADVDDLDEAIRLGLTPRPRRESTLTLIIAVSTIAIVCMVAFFFYQRQKQ